MRELQLENRLRTVGVEVCKGVWTSTLVGKELVYKEASEQLKGIALNPYQEYSNHRGTLQRISDIVVIDDERDYEAIVLRESDCDHGINIKVIRKDDVFILDCVTAGTHPKISIQAEAYGEVDIRVKLTPAASLTLDVSGCNARYITICNNKKFSTGSVFSKDIVIKGAVKSVYLDGYARSFKMDTSNALLLASMWIDNLRLGNCLMDFKDIKVINAYLSSVEGAMIECVSAMSAITSSLLMSALAWLDRDELPDDTVDKLILKHYNQWEKKFKECGMTTQAHENETLIMKGGLCDAVSEDLGVSISLESAVTGIYDSVRSNVQNAVWTVLKFGTGIWKMQSLVNCSQKSNKTLKGNPQCGHLRYR